MLWTGLYTKRFETNRNQSEIIQGFKFKQTGNIKDDICLDIFNIIFGGSQTSRLFKDMREQRHLAYSVNSGYKISGDYGVEYLKINFAIHFTSA